MDIRITLGDYLDAHNLSAYRLAQETSGKVARGSIYALARGEVKRVDLDTLGAVMETLERLTGEPVKFDDLLEAVGKPPAGISAAGVAYTGDPETDEVLDDHPDILERLAKLERGEAKLIPWEQVKAELGL
ncbi:hypothetical protein BH24DEI1_BH24DEI1_04150 [soil metagenome]|jgi:DNA-binding Xre family transcriptional regulator|nr:helix-turn-helix transcriptional regulator [Deinococcota bacterium]